MATKLNLKEAKVAAITALFEKTVHAQPSGEYVRLFANGRSAAYLSQRKDYAWLRFDHLAVDPTAAEWKSFGADGRKGNCILVRDTNLDAVLAFAKRLVAETPKREVKAPAKPKAAKPKAEKPADEPEAPKAEACTFGHLRLPGQSFATEAEMHTALDALDKAEAALAELKDEVQPEREPVAAKEQPAKPKRTRRTRKPAE